MSKALRADWGKIRDQTVKTRNKAVCLVLTLLLVVIVMLLIVVLIGFTRMDEAPIDKPNMNRVVPRVSERPHRINAQTFAMIQKGMTEQEVIDILGGPYGQYFKGCVTVTCPRGRHNSPVCMTCEELDENTLCAIFALEGQVFMQRKGWVAADLAVWIWLDANGIVCDKIAYEGFRFTGNEDQ